MTGFGTKLALLAFVFIGFPNLASSNNLVSEDGNLCKDSDYVKEIRWFWKKTKPIYQQWVLASDKTPYNLYNVQGETNNLLKYAEACNDRYILSELISLYLKAIDTLDETTQYAFYYYPGDKRRSVSPLDKKHRMWLDEKIPVGDETILVSTQFLSIISETINIIAGIQYRERTQDMQKFIREYRPILEDHYLRWIVTKPGPFQVRGWGCTVDNKYVQTGMNHRKFIQKKINRQLGDDNSPSYCNAVTDTDLWILSGISDFLAAEVKEHRLVSIEEQGNIDSLSVHLNVGLELISRRITETDLVDFDGRKVKAANFDLGAWDDHPDYQYAGFNSQKKTSIKDLTNSKPGVNVGWDLSHARRLVHVFDSLYRNKTILNKTFPTIALMKKLSNQLLYGAFNKDFKQPQFTNFMDGTNGWFRVDYSERKGFGYEPWDMSSSVLTGGFGFWFVYNKDIELVFKSMIDMLKSNDSKVKWHVKEHYERNFWNEYERVKSLNFKDRDDPNTQRAMLQLLPSMCFHSAASLP